MAAVGDRTALLSYQDDAELAELEAQTTDATDEFDGPARGRRQKLWSLFDKNGPFVALFRLNLVTVIAALILMVLFGGFIAPLYVSLIPIAELASFAGQPRKLEIDADNLLIVSHIMLITDESSCATPLSLVTNAISRIHSFGANTRHSHP